MNRRSTDFYFVVVVTLTLLASQWTGVMSASNVTTGPVNTAARIDTETLLNCTVALESNDFMIWQYSNEQHPIFTVYHSPDDTTLDETNFGIEKDAAGEYNLMVKKVSFSLSATYKCDLARSTQTSGKSAELIALGQVKCTNPGTVAILHGSLENMTCSVEYAGKVVPTLKWTDPDGNDLFGTLGTPTTKMENQVTVHGISLIHEITLEGEDDEKEYTCNVEFDTTDAPDYTDSCTTIYLVEYPVSEMTIFPINVGEDYPHLAVGESINCTGNGRPAPDTSWVSESGEVVIDGSDLTITEDMVSNDPQTWICNGTNALSDGETASASANVTFYADSGDSQAVQSSGTEDWVIAVAVVVPVVCCCAIAVGVFLFIRHRRKKNDGVAGKNGKSNGTNGGGAATQPMLSPTTGQAPIYSSPNRGPNAAPRVNYNYSAAPNGGIRVSGIDSPGYADLGVRVNGSTTSINRSNGSVTMNPNPKGFPPPANGSTNGVLLRPTSSASSTSSRAPSHAPSYGRLDYDPSGMGPAQPRSPRSDTSSISQGSAV